MRPPGVAMSRPPVALGTTRLSIEPSLVSVLERLAASKRWMVGVRMSTQYSAPSRVDHIGASPSNDGTWLTQWTSAFARAGGSLFAASDID